MASRELDALNRRILYTLQAEARRASSTDIANSFDTSASTVRNRIQRLEADGVFCDYHADVDYERTGYQLYTPVVCTAPIPEREELAEVAAAVSDIAEVQEVMTGERNVMVRAIGVDGDDLSHIGEELDELGLRVSDEDLIRNIHRSPYARFGDGDEQPTA